MKKTALSIKALIVIALASVIAMPNHADAQKRKKKKDEPKENHDWDYTVKRNSPQVLPKYSISLYPLIIQTIAIEGFGLGAELGGSYQINQNFEINAGVDYNYVTTAKSISDNPYYTAPIALGNYNFELTGTWFFSNETKNKDEMVLLYTESVGYRSYINHMAKIPLDHQQKFGVRFGFGYWSYPSGTLDQPYNIYRISDPSQTEIQTNSNSLMTNIHTGMLVIGLASEKVHDYKLRFNNGVEREVSRKLSWHLDLLVNAFTSFDNVIAFGGGADSAYNVGKYTKASPIGARISFTNESLRPFGGGWGFNLGVIPGAPAPLFIGGFKYGMNFNAKMD